MTAAIYIRKSRKDKDKPSHRLELQREQLPAYAKSQGWAVEIYDDGHASAARGKVEDLRERSRMESDIRSGKVDVILTIELSRLSRDDSLQDYVAWLYLCGEHGVRLATMSRILDPGQHSDWMLLLMEGGFSSVEMKVLKGRMREGWEQAFRAGMFLGGTPPPPYVYDHAQERPIIDQMQLPKLQRIWSLAETRSAKSIASEMDMPEITVRRILSDDRLLFCQALRIDPQTGQVIQCEWEQCLDAETAARVRAGRRTRKNGQGKKAYAALLSNLGLVWCGYCGRTVKVWHNSRIRRDGTRNDYYGCQTKNDKSKCPKARLIPQQALNDRVLTNLFHTIEDLEPLKQYWQIAAEKSNPGKELQTIENKLKKATDKKSRLVSAIADGILDFADAKQKMNELNAEIEHLRGEERTALALAVSIPDWDALSVSRVDFDSLTTDRQRDIISMAISRIDLFENYAIITYPFPRNEDGDRIARIHLPPRKDGYITTP